MEIQHSTKEVKNVLVQYKKYIWMIEDLSRQIEDIGDKALCVKSTSNLTGMPRGGSPYTYTDMIDDKDDLERRKARFEKIANQKKEIVQSYIDTVVSVKHNRFLTLYYIKCLTISEISRIEVYTERHAFRVFHEALEMVDLSLNL
jgi:hypothetical protein